MASFLQSLAPLVALYIMHRVLRAIGLGGLTKLSGSVGLATQAALAASGDPNWRRAGGRAFDQAASKIGGRASYGTKTRSEEKHLARRASMSTALDVAKKRGLAALAGRDVYRSESERQGGQRFQALRDVARANRAGGQVRAERRAALDLAAGSEARRAMARRAAQAALPRANVDPALVNEEQRARRKEIDARLAELSTGDPRRRALIEEAARMDEAAAVAATWGPEMVGAVLPDAALALARAETAATLGVPEAAVLVSSLGLPPQVVPSMTGIYEGLSPAATVARLSDVAEWLPPAVQSRQVINGLPESDDQYAARLFHLSVACGAIDPASGSRVDWLATHGIDASTPAAQAALEAAAQGDRSPLRALASGSLDVVLTADMIARANAARNVVGAESVQRALDSGLRESFERQLDVFTSDQQALEVTTASFTSAADAVRRAIEGVSRSSAAGSVSAATVAGLVSGYEGALRELRQSARALAEHQATARMNVLVDEAVQSGDEAVLTDDALEARYQELATQAHASVDELVNNLERNLGVIQRSLNVPRDRVNAGALTRAVAQTQTMLDQATQALAGGSVDVRAQGRAVIERLTDTFDARRAAYQRDLDSLAGVRTRPHVRELVAG